MFECVCVVILESTCNTELTHKVIMCYFNEYFNESFNKKDVVEGV